jgi:hypothetical protein
MQNEDLINLIGIKLKIFDKKIQYTDFILKKADEIILKYNIQNKDELISVSKARSFIYDVFGNAWSYPEILIRNALKFDCLTVLENRNNKKFKISYMNIYKLMFTPFYKIMEKGRLHKK